MTSAQQKIEKLIQSKYLKSRDFNGLPLTDLLLATKRPAVEIIHDLIELINDRRVVAVFESDFPNIHIKAFPNRPVDEMVDKLKTDKIGSIALYPSEEILKKGVPADKSLNKPFTRRLLLGEPQLKPLFFHFDVLERYYSEPRYHFQFEDNQGSISIVDKHYRSRSMPAKDKVLIQTFGVGYTTAKSNRDRVIAVYLRYLADLSPQHQQVWNTFLSKRKCVINYDYHLNTMGHWTDHGSIYTAFLEEQRHINEMCKLMAKPPLFRKTFHEDRPREFSSFFRPTKKNYQNFILLLDKMLSENLNKKFFEAFHIPTKDAEEKERGTLSLLEEFLKTKFVTKEKTGIQTIIEELRQIRTLRQKPAHKIEADEYDRRYFTMQSKLIRKVYIALRYIRLVFANHPKVKGYEIDEWLFKGMIREY